MKKTNGPYITESLLRSILDEYFEVVDERFNKIEKQLQSMTLDNQIRDRQLNQHERWHQQTANKLEVKLA